VDLQRRDPGHRLLLCGRWNYTALATNNQLNSSYFQYVQGYPAVAPRSGRPTARTLSGLRVVNPTTFTVALDQKFSGWPRTLGSFVYDPLPASFFRDPAAWAKHPVGDGPYTVASYLPGRELDLVPFDRYAGRQRPQNQGVDLKVYNRPGRLVRGPARGQPGPGRHHAADPARQRRPRPARDGWSTPPSGTLSHLAFRCTNKALGTVRAAPRSGRASPWRSTAR